MPLHHNRGVDNMSSTLQLRHFQTVSCTVRTTAPVVEPRRARQQPGPRTVPVSMNSWTVGICISATTGMSCDISTEKNTVRTKSGTCRCTSTGDKSCLSLHQNGLGKRMSENCTCVETAVSARFVTNCWILTLPIKGTMTRRTMNMYPLSSQAGTRMRRKSVPRLRELFLPPLLSLPLRQRGGQVDDALRTLQRLTRTPVRFFPLFPPPLLLLLLQSLAERDDAEIFGGGAVDAVATSHRRHHEERHWSSHVREWKLLSPWRVVLFALHSLSRCLHPLRAVVDGRCQLHGHRHPLVTVPCSELAPLRRHAAPCPADIASH